MLSKLLTSFDQVVISEYWENTFKLKINKKDNSSLNSLNNTNSISIGYLFGLLDNIKDECNLAEYSITSTSLEQIFNYFAAQDESKTKSIDNNKNHKREIEINKDYLHKFSKIKIDLNSYKNSNYSNSSNIDN